MRGEPLFITVRLRNPGAMLAARNAYLLQQGRRMPTRALEQEEAPLASSLPRQEESVITELALLDDWRERVAFSLERLNEDGQGKLMEVDFLRFRSVAKARQNAKQVDSHTAVGARPRMAGWALALETTAELQPGDYRIQSRVDASGLFEKKYDDLAVDKVFPLTAPGSAQDQARVDLRTAYFHFMRGDCQQTAVHGHKALKVESVGFPTYWYLAECHALQGRPTGDAPALRPTIPVPATVRP